MAPVIVLIVLASLILLVIFYKKPVKKITLPNNFKQLLSYYVPFYRRLNEEDKLRFEERIGQFLAYIRIDGINTNVDDLDKLLVASSAVIPTFGFPAWKYYNLHNVLLYPETFNKEEFLESGFEKDTLGMVGSGAMQKVMILSKPALREGFANEGTKANTGIHEFVHLLDKEDGEVDGLPESLLGKQYSASWVQMANKNITEVLSGQSDINPYATTNKAEFFAVVAEYFFTSPHLFKERHAALYEFMVKIFKQDPADDRYNMDG